jgi:hypothetical protein
MATIDQAIRPYISEAQWKQKYARLEKDMPELWEGLYPRIYPNPPCCGEYCPAEDAAHILLTQFYEAGHYRGSDADKKRTHFIVMAEELKASRMPHTWIGQGIVEAIKRTKPPTPLNWTTVALSFPAMILMLPKGALLHPSEGDVRFIAYSRFLGVKRDGTRMGMFVFFGFSERGIVLAGEFSDCKNASVSFHDGGVQSEALRLLFNTLLIMRARPDLVTESQLLNRVYEIPKPAKEFWSCRVLGEHYTMRQKQLNDHGALSER